MGRRLSACMTACHDRNSIEVIEPAALGAQNDNHSGLTPWALSTGNTFRLLEERAPDHATLIGEPTRLRLTGFRVEDGHLLKEKARKESTST